MTKTQQDKLIRKLKRILSANEMYILSFKKDQLVKIIFNHDWTLWIPKESFLLEHHWTLEEYLEEIHNHLQDIGTIGTRKLFVSSLKKIH